MAHHHDLGLQRLSNYLILTESLQLLIYSSPESEDLFHKASRFTIAPPCFDLGPGLQMNALDSLNSISRSIAKRLVSGKYKNGREQAREHLKYLMESGLRRAPSFTLSAKRIQAVL